MEPVLLASCNCWCADPGGGLNLARNLARTDGFAVVKNSSTGLRSGRAAHGLLEWALLGDVAGGVGWCVVWFGAVGNLEDSVG